MDQRKIYVASSWRNSYYPDVVNKLRATGHDVYDFRNPLLVVGTGIWVYPSTCPYGYFPMATPLHAYRVGYIIIHTYTHIIYARYAIEYQNIVSHVSFEKLKLHEGDF